MAERLSGIDGMAQQALLRRPSGGSTSSLLKSRTLLDQLRSGNRGADPAATRQALREVAKEFEAVFLNQLVSAMRKTVGESGLIDKGEGEKVFEGMLDEEWARNLAGRHGAGGLSDLIYRQLSRRMGLDDGTQTGGQAPHSLAQLPLTVSPQVQSATEP
mgnify:CR=1 FL=1